MEFKTFLSEIRSDLESYDAAGLIDETSIYRWMIDALEPFGNNLMVKQDTVVNVENSKGYLPLNFYSLYIAIKCSKRGYVVEDKYKTKVQSSRVWKDTVQEVVDWNECKDCEPIVDGKEQRLIVNKVFYEGLPVDYYYDQPIPLKLSKNMPLNRCHTQCRNRYIKDSPWEISISGKTLYTNFKKGEVYLQYYGYPLSEDGMMEVPEQGNNHLIRYVESYVKKKFFEKLIANNDAPNLITLFQLYASEARDNMSLASTDIKMSRLTPSSFDRLKRLNRAEMYKYESLFPSI